MNQILNFPYDKVSNQKKGGIDLWVIMYQVPLLF